ncbi:phage portal protein [Weizmannia acidilactici]|uniref:phage portal protein n=2 Tax=Bacilli TaxID=91061 RepID=UPI00124EA21B|nr:phage portal protein [Weizmannia acidilactici]GER73427.1 portal protein [Weizmannia acidilactici]
MFQNILARLKGLFAKMGLIKEISNVSQLAAVQESERQYNRIEIWRYLYHGHLAQYYGVPFHETHWTSVDGVRHKRRRATMGMPKVVSQEMAKLVFNEKCVINISCEGNEAVEEMLQDILKRSHFHKLFQDKLEAMFAMGGLVIKPYYKDDGLHFSFVTADCFLPVQSTNDHIEAGVFLNVTRRGKKFYTLLEWHTWDDDGTYVITNELYESDTEGALGHKVPLTILYPDIEPETRIDGLTHPLFVYIKPNLANNFELDSPLGISIFANAIDTLKSIDVAFDSFQREFILGKKRIMVPQQALRTVVDPSTGEVRRYFDVEDEVFKAYADTDNEDKIQDISVELRVQEHIDAINALLNILASQIGFSAGTFAFTGGASVQTATQVISENSQTFRTKNSHETVIEAGLKELIHVMAEMLVLYGELDSIPEIDVTVDFDDSIAEDRIQNANFYMTLVAAELMPKVEAIQRIFDLTEEQAQEWLDRIKQENSQPVPQMMDSFLSTAETSIRNVNRTGR